MWKSYQAVVEHGAALANPPEDAPRVWLMIWTAFVVWCLIEGVWEWIERRDRASMRERKSER